MRRERKKVRGEYRFNSLMKQNKKGRKCAVLYCPGNIKLFVYCLCGDMLHIESYCSVSAGDQGPVKQSLVHLQCVVLVEIFSSSTRQNMIWKEVL